MEIITRHIKWKFLHFHNITFLFQDEPHHTVTCHRGSCCTYSCLHPVQPHIDNVSSTRQMLQMLKNNLKSGSMETLHSGISTLENARSKTKRATPGAHIQLLDGNLAMTNQHQNKEAIRGYFLCGASRCGCQASEDFDFHGSNIYL